MTFQPVVPFSGYPGWTFLQRTMDNQKAAFESSAPIQRATDAFRERIGNITSAADLVADRQLLEVALGAFGLGDDINNKYFIQKILEDGALSSDALANRLSDKRYLSMATVFGFGEFGDTGLTQTANFADTIIDRYEARTFEAAVGAQNNDMRLALNFEPEMQDILDNTENVNARWFSIMGSEPLRNVVETALGLPSGLAGVDLDLQLTQFKERSNAVFGTEDPGDLLSSENQEKLLRLFFVRSEAAATANLSGASIAITLLQGIA